MNQRNGTDVDAANAMKTFGKLGYKVKVFNDQTVDQIKKLLAGGKTDGVEVFFFIYVNCIRVWCGCVQSSSSRLSHGTTFKVNVAKPSPLSDLSMVVETVKRHLL